MGQDTNSGDAREPQHTGNAAPRLRLLIVDDDALNRDMMQLMLAPLGHDLEFACDGGEALQAIQGGSFDLVFMDLMLPDMSGRAVARRVRELEAGKQHLPIVAVTAYDMPGQPLEIARAGMDDYIFKPYDLRGLQRVIQLYASQETGASLDPQQPGVLPGPEVPVLDTAGSLADFSNDVAGYKELLRDFIAGLRLRLEKMQQAHTDGDLDRLNNECHTLKGVSAGLGAMRLSRVATLLGRSCVEGKRAAVGPLMEEMERSMAELQAEAAGFLAS